MKIKKSHIQLIEKVTDWKEAIRYASKPLIAEGVITENYVEKMIENVLIMGPYMVLSKDIAMPHARPEDGANESCIAILKIKERINFYNDSNNINTIIILASSNNENHVQILKEVSSILMDPNSYNKLIESINVDVIYNLFSTKVEV